MLNKILHSIEVAVAALMLLFVFGGMAYLYIEFIYLSITR